MNPTSRASALAALLLGAVSLSLTPIFVRLAETGPAAAGFWRLFLALPLLALMTFRKGAPGGKPDRLMILAGVFFALDLGFWHYGIANTSVMNATVLANMTPIVVTIVGWWLFRERPARAFVIGLALGVAGAVMVAMARSSTIPAGANPDLGNLFSLLTTVWFSGYFLCVRAARTTRGTSAIMFWSSLVGAAALAGAMVALGEDITPETLGGWGACLGLALVHVGGQGSIAWALGRLPAASASVVILIQPVITAALGWFLFSEAVGPLQAAGAVLVLAGVAIAQWASARQAPK